jgi:hypothetical protein
MIRKLLVVAAAVAMPAATMAGVTAVTGAGIAAAAKPAPVPVTCSLSGTVTFNKPGLSPTGSITKKTTATTKTAVTPGGASACGTKAIKSKIPSATTACWSTLPTYTDKLTYTGGVLASGAAAACDVGGSSAVGDANLNAKTIKTAIKDQYYYDTVGSLLSGPADILTALAAGVKTQDNGNNIVLVPSAASSILPGGACGASEVGFAISGSVTGGLGVLTAFSMNICLGGDTGPGTTNAFFADLTGGTATIASALLDPATSSVTLS